MDSGIVTAVGWGAMVILNVIIFAASRRDKLGDRIDKLRDRVDTLIDRVGGLEQRVSHIEGRLGPPVPATIASPLRLTEYGENISAVVDAPLWASQHVTTLSEKVRDKRPYEIEEISFAFAEQYDPSPSMRDAMWEHGYSIEHVRTVLGIVLRDELLRHSEVA